MVSVPNPNTVTSQAFTTISINFKPHPKYKHILTITQKSNKTPPSHTIHQQFHKPHSKQHKSQIHKNRNSEQPKRQKRHISKPNILKLQTNTVSNQNFKNQSQVTNTFQFINPHARSKPPNRHHPKLFPTATNSSTVTTRTIHQTESQSIIQNPMQSRSHAAGINTNPKRNSKERQYILTFRSRLVICFVWIFDCRNKNQEKEQKKISGKKRKN